MSEKAESAPVTVIGPGSVGGALLHELHHVGGIIQSVVLRSRSSSCPDRFLNVAIPIEELQRDQLGKWIFLAVPDDQIRPVAEKLVELRGGSWEGTSVAHLSGVANSSSLEPLSKRGARTASCHPLQTFARGQEGSIFKNIHVTLEGEQTFLDELHGFWLNLGATPRPVSREQKRRLHLAAVFLSNYLVSLAAISEEILKEAIPNGDLTMLGPLLETTTSNLLHNGPVPSLTGPIERGDLQTLMEHTTLMERGGERMELYVALGRVAARLASSKGQDPAVTEEVLDLLVGQKKQ